MINEPKIVEITEIITETPTIKTFKFDWDFETLGKPNPGEFLMIWNFNNEKPMSISQINDNELAITVKNIGEFTSQLHDLQVGDQIGVRGSYGNGFDNSFEGKKIIAIGGGVGMAPVNAIASYLAPNNEVSVISAAQTKMNCCFWIHLKSQGSVFTHALMMEVLDLKDLQQIVLAICLKIQLMIMHLSADLR